MRLLFVADGRSPTTISWLSHWISSGDEVHLISTYPCEPMPGLASFSIINTAFSALSSVGHQKSRNKILSIVKNPLRIARSYFGPLSLGKANKQFLSLVDSINPDLVHALRIPFEGLLSRKTPAKVPFIISIWGNDLTLHAKSSPIMALTTRETLRRADALFADTHRDIRLGCDWGFRKGTKTMVIPGNGGVKIQEMNSKKSSCSLSNDLPDEPIIVNPRGQRPGSLRQDIFIHAIKYYIQSDTKGIFVCPSLLGDASIAQLIRKLGILDRVFLWPKITQPELWSLYSKATIYASPSIHDGTPNSMLEAMAMGCFPVTGNIESMHEWITNGENGIMVNARNAKEIAGAFLRVINDSSLQEKGAIINSKLIAERANYENNMSTVRDIYKQLVN